MKYEPAKDSVVVRSERAGDLDRLGTMLQGEAEVETITGDAHSRLVRFHEPGDSKSRVQALQVKLGKGFQVFPLLLDPRGQPLLPTGQVRVRFQKRVGEQDLKKFATRYSLKFVQRDELAPEQATFQVQKPGDYLLDAIERATGSEDVRLAWPETSAKYTKSG